MENSQTQPKTDFDRARQALRIMQAALEKAKTNHGDLFTFGDCASVYGAMININNFIDKFDQQEQARIPQQQQQQNVNSPFLTLNQQSTPTINYQTN